MVVFSVTVLVFSCCSVFCSPISRLVIWYQSIGLGFLNPDPFSFLVRYRRASFCPPSSSPSDPVVFLWLRCCSSSCVVFRHEVASDPIVKSLCPVVVAAVGSGQLLCEKLISEFLNGLVLVLYHPLDLSTLSTGFLKIDFQLQYSLLKILICLAVLLHLFAVLPDLPCSTEECIYTVREKEKGFARALPLDDFLSSSNGFLQNGGCMFGAEVFVADAIAKNARLSTLNENTNSIYTWVIEDFSKLSDCELSSMFISEGHPWRLQIHPRGWGTLLNSGLLLYLIPDDTSDLTNGRKFFVQVELRIKNLQNLGDAVGTDPSCGVSHGKVQQSHMKLLCFAVLSSFFSLRLTNLSSSTSHTCFAYCCSSSISVTVMMGRSPCCEKAHTNKGAWTKEEDDRLIAYIKVHGEGCWRSLPKAAGLLRCGKSCRLRWINYLRPDLKRGNFSEEEDELIIKLHSLLGNKWSLIAGRLPGRTDNEIKNYWNTHIKRKLMGRGIDPVTHRPLNESSSPAAGDTTSISFAATSPKQEASPRPTTRNMTPPFSTAISDHGSMDQDAEERCPDLNLELRISLPQQYQPEQLRTGKRSRSGSQSDVGYHDFLGLRTGACV
ncbi:hypothetical protein Droror1_Dr00001274 [Drosera rotundifolia]